MYKCILCGNEEGKFSKHNGEEVCQECIDELERGEPLVTVVPRNLRESHETFTSSMTMDEQERLTK